MGDVFSPDVSVQSAFGLLKTVEENVVLHLAFPYNINTALVATATANGGTVDQFTAQARLQTSAAANGSAIMTSKDAVKYTPGQGVLARFTAVFSPGRLNSSQEVGIGDTVDGYFFGFSGSTFGIIYRNGSVTAFIPRSLWNNPFPSIDPTKGNVYSVAFQYLGYGVIRFYIEDPILGARVLVHTINYPNQAIIPSLTNPSLVFRVAVANTGNTSNLTVLTASMGATTEGPPNNYGLLGATQNRKTGVGGVPLTNIVSLRNNSTFAGKANKIRTKLIGLAYASGADANIGLFLNPAVAGPVAFTDFDTATSPIAIDIGGTDVSGGRRIFASTSENGAGAFVDLSSILNYRMNPGDILVAAAGAASGSTIVSAAITWRDEV